MLEMIRIIPEATKIDVKQKYPTVPTREFLTVKITGNSGFRIYAGPNQRQIYQGGTQGDKIISYYFDGMNAVFTCQKRIIVYGPRDQKNPTKGWHQIKAFPAH